MCASDVIIILARQVQTANKVIRLKESESRVESSRQRIKLYGDSLKNFEVSYNFFPGRFFDRVWDKNLITRSHRVIVCRWRLTLRCSINLLEIAVRQNRIYKSDDFGLIKIFHEWKKRDADHCMPFGC